MKVCIGSLGWTALLAGALLLAPLRGQAQQVEDYRLVSQSLSSQHGAAVVAVKFVMSLAASGKEERLEDTTQALLVSKDGLLLVPDRAVSLDLGTLIPGSSGAGSSAPVAKSSEFRVRLAGSDDWLPADLVTRDSQLGIAWLRLRHPPAAGLNFVNLDDGIRAEPGMVFFTLMRTSDDWGGVTVFRPGLVLGQTQTPRQLLLVDGAPGVAFSPDGHPLGYVDVDFGKMMRNRNGGTGLGLDMADATLQMTPIDKIAAATRLAAKLPAVASGFH
jgi:hypothetical protein